MPDIVPVTIDVEPDIAAALDDPATRARVVRVVSHMLQTRNVESLFTAIAALKKDAQRRGLTDEIVDEELAAYNAERRDVPTRA